MKKLNFKKKGLKILKLRLLFFFLSSGKRIPSDEPVLTQLTQNCGSGIARMGGDL